MMTRLSFFNGSGIAIFSLVLFLCPPNVEAAGPVDIRMGHMRFSGQVKSLAELRWNKLTRQGWDVSCGAAALSTLLTYHSGRPFSEMGIALSILKNSDPALVRKRGGFSLYDLKRFVRAIGLEGLGYGDMTIKDLENFDIPAILSIRIRDLDHFVVFRKRLGNHVFIGDPAFGNISLPLHRFEKMWKGGTAFYVVTSTEKAAMEKQGKTRTRSPLFPEAMEIAVPRLNYGTRLLSRIPAIPITRQGRLGMGVSSP